MKKKIVILGSTGSIGKNTISLIKKDKKNFDIKLLSTNKNTSVLIKQAKEFKSKRCNYYRLQKIFRNKKKI